MNPIVTVRSALALLFVTGIVAAQIQWSQVAVSNAPMAYCGSAYDDNRDRLVAFGGEQGIAQTDTTREFDPAVGQWTTVLPANRPSPRRRPAMAFDAARGECVLFGGGATPGQFFNDTWTWDGTVWTQRTPTTVPPVRHGASMAYDSVRQVVVMFGGFVQSGQDLGDCWEWNGTNWTQRTFTGGPSPRGAHRMVFDEARGQTVLYGGYRTPQQSTVADTWLWDGTSWTPGAGGPGSLCDQLFVYDRHRSRVVLWGGLRIQNLVLTDLSATYEWNGTAWTQRFPAGAPTARSAMAAGFAPWPVGRVLCGGGAQNTGTQFGSTFALVPTAPATELEFGNGCPTTAGAVDLAAVSLPYVGTDFVHEIRNAPPVAFVGLIAFGLSDQFWSGVPLPLDLTLAGAPGCSVLVSPDVLLVTLLNNGTGGLTWSLPNQQSLVGLTFFTQALVLDPLLPLAFQIGSSSGRRFTIGAP